MNFPNTYPFFRGNRAVGVEYLHDRKLYQVRVNEEVILSAGTINSPKLLLQSGIGNAKSLQARGISVVGPRKGSGGERPRLKLLLS